MKRAREHGIFIGELPTGKRNLVTDVPGVRVGHTTISDGKHSTGVTVLLPCEDNPFSSKLTAACHVLNGFGKTTGLMQLEELGNIETPIALTNTLNVGLVHDAMVGYMIDRCQQEDLPLRSVNPIVCECNDAALNDICSRAVQQEHVLSAIQSASETFELGAVGAGRGMTCHGLKGGIGSASRILEFDGQTYTVGVLTLTNHGRLSDLTIQGQNIGKNIQKQLTESLPDKGSCIVIMATDLPTNDRQLKRIIRRAGVALARLGSYTGHGSGEVFLGFTTANRVPHSAERTFIPMTVLHEDSIDLVFRAMAEATEEAVLDSMLTAEPITNQNGVIRRSLAEFL